MFYMITHGTTSAYVSGCRCDECRESWSAYQRDLRQRRKNGQVRPRIANGSTDYVHGTRNTYQLHGCRCEECKTAQRDYMLMRTYGMSEADKLAMLEDQGGCAACGRTPETYDGRWHVDHDHKTGDVRAVLCHGCNVALGFMNEDPYAILGLMKYAEGLR